MEPVTMAMLGGSALSAIGGWDASRRSAREMRKMRREMKKARQFAQQQWQHYRDTYGDLEQMMVADAMEGVQGDFAGVTGRAAADVEGAFAGERERQQRDMASFGLDPSSGRYQSADRRAGLEMATASAGMQNRAREGERRHAEDATRGMRMQTGQFGASMTQNAANNLQGAMTNMGNMHGQNAAMFGGMADNLFMQAGQMGMYGLHQMQGQPQQQVMTGSPQMQGMQANVGTQPMNMNLSNVAPQFGVSGPQPGGGGGWNQSIYSGAGKNQLNFGGLLQ